MLTEDGIFVLSTDKNPSNYINNGIRKIKIYPDLPNETAKFAVASYLSIINYFETEFAYIFVMSKKISTFSAEKVEKN